MEIIAWIVGSENISTEKPQKFLVSGDKFTMSKFIGKRVNFSDEINNLTPDMLENLKAMIGGISQSAEYKNKNEGRIFDPKRFLFIFGTNYLDSIYQKVDDNSTINRFQFMKFNHVIKKKKGDWENEFFKDDEDKQSAIETIINLMLFWKRSKQIFDFDEAWKTKEILRAEIPVEDKYFESGRIIVKRGAKLFLDDIKRDFETYCSVPVSNQTLGYLLKDKGYVTKKSGGKMYIQGFTLSESSSNERID